MNVLSKVLFVTLGALLVCYIFLLPACSSSNEANPSPTIVNNGKTPTVQPASNEDGYVELVYFHRTRRCYSCQYAGDMTEHIVETYFNDELANGKLHFEMLDVQNSANAEMVNKYRTYGSSMYINVVTDGKDHIKAITNIWYQIGNDDKFTDIVKTEIETALGSI